MSPDEITAVLTLLQVAATIGLALIVQQSTSRIARLEFSRSVRENWIAIDELALSDAETLKAADALLLQPIGPGAIDPRKRWFILAYLNPIVTAYQGAQGRIYGRDKDAVIAGCEQQLEVLFGDEDAYWVTQNHGHEASFMTLCERVHDRVKANREALAAKMADASRASLG